MPVDTKPIERLYAGLDPLVRERVDLAVARIVAVKERGGKIVVVTGSGPNVHEGVTTLIAELIHKGLVDGVTTSSAVINHEMAGALEKVHRVDGTKLGLDPARLPLDLLFEASIMPEEQLEAMAREMPIDRCLFARILAAEGRTIIKAAGNMAYPLGLRTERLAREAESLAKANGQPLEAVAGQGADPRTMIGAGARRGVPVLVSVPQLIGGGAVGLALGDSLSITERAARVARMLGSADAIVESAVALTQEIHDGPFETLTGHGIWADWEGCYTYSLRGKTLIRIDLDPNLEAAWRKQRETNVVAEAIAQGLPKTKMTGVPFRMEMSGFSRLEGSIPIIADIGVIWPILAVRAAAALGVTLDFLSYPQATLEGQAMREWIVREVRPLDREAMYAAFRNDVKNPLPLTQG